MAVPDSISIIRVDFFCMLENWCRVARLIGIWMAALMPMIMTAATTGTQTSTGEIMNITAMKSRKKGRSTTVGSRREA